MRVRRFGHAGLLVGDLNEAEEFYRGALGFSVITRFPEDGESMLAVGEGDHLLLQGTGQQGGGTHHVAFELAEGRRGVDEAERRLAALGVACTRVDHDGDPSVYFHDPHGNLLEAYAAPGSTPCFGSAADRLAAAGDFLHGNARLVDRAIFEHRFGAGSEQRVLAAVCAYRNADGGFGHALEPDVRCPGSQPLHTITALELLREAGIRAPELADDCCAWFAAVADGEFRLPALNEDALGYPAAAHWQNERATERGMGWTLGACAQLSWHGATHPWLADALAACRAALAEPPREVHQLVYAIRFASTLPAALPEAALYVSATPVLDYGLTPLHVAPSPDTAAASHLPRGLLEAHLDDLLDSQQGDGGWPIRFRPPSEGAMQEWRGRWTLEALSTLRAYGRL